MIPARTGSSAIIGVYGMQAEAERSGVFDKCGQSIETHIAEPDY